MAHVRVAGFDGIRGLHCGGVSERIQLRNQPVGGMVLRRMGFERRANGSPVLRSLVKVNKILQTHNHLPTFFINGYSEPNDFFSQLDGNGVEIPVWMNEFYFLGAATYCQPGPKQACGWPTPLHMWTSYSSDTTYYIYAEDCNDNLPCGQHRYEGYKSLQCTIDGSIWEWDPIFELGNIQMPPGVDPLPHWFNLRPQVELRDLRRANGHDEKFWALICGNEDAPNDTDGCCPIRTPSPNEVKLMAWLAVACDVDGIMWYPWNFGGLLEWDTTSHMFQKTERYTAAKKACNEIKRVSENLEPLAFVKTYASRAFEHNYPYNGNAATQLDTLATNCQWHGQNYRAMYGIAAWVPDTTRPSGWSSTAELHPYVQVTRFRNRSYALHDPAREDYWFLIVNRRALENERRKIRLALEVDSTYQDSVYYVDHILSRGVSMAEMDSSRVDNRAMRYIDVILEPGEAELVHFFRGAPNCDTTLAHVQQLTVIPAENSAVRLNWEEVTLTDSGDAFHTEYYTILGSSEANGEFAPIDTSTTTTYLDSINISQYPRYFYQVKVCGWITN